MRRGQMERWEQARELALKGCRLSEASKITGLHHASLIYIAQRMGFEWPSNMRGKYLRKPLETVGRVERMMRLAEK